MKVIKNMLIIKSRLGSPLTLLACFTYIFEKVRKLFKFSVMEKSFNFLKGNLIIFLGGAYLKKTMDLTVQGPKSMDEVTFSGSFKPYYSVGIASLYLILHTQYLPGFHHFFLVASYPVCACSGSHDFLLLRIPSSFGNFVNRSRGDHRGNR